MKTNLGFANDLLEQLLELSADAQIERRTMAIDRPAIDRLNGEIAAYGKVLTVLTGLLKREEFNAIIRKMGLAQLASERVN
jgi:hypothetical protein